jgi:replicative DNA helicase
MVEVKKFKPDVVIDDYIQLIQPTPGIDTRRLQLERICNDYKWLAKTQKCSVILASQLNRQLEYRNGKDLVPQLSDLAESGAIEQVAENVYFVHYHHKIKPDDKKSSPNKITLYAKKVRYGKTGSHVLGYDGDKCKIYGTYGEYEDSLRN